MRIALWVDRCTHDFSVSVLGGLRLCICWSVDLSHHSALSHRSYGHVSATFTQFLVRTSSLRRITLVAERVYVDTENLCIHGKCTHGGKTESLETNFQDEELQLLETGSEYRALLGLRLVAAFLGTCTVQTTECKPAGAHWERKSLPTDKYLHGRTGRTASTGRPNQVTVDRD